MTAGAAAQFVFRGMRPDAVLGGYERALVDCGFRIQVRQPEGTGYAHKAVWGSKAKAYLVGSFVPFGKLMQSGKRLGAEAQISAAGGDTLLRLIVLPYMELFDSPEVFLISQGVFEKLTDDDFARGKLGEVSSRMWALGLRWG